MKKRASLIHFWQLGPVQPLSSGETDDREMLFSEWLLADVVTHACCIVSECTYDRLSHRQYFSTPF